MTLELVTLADRADLTPLFADAETEGFPPFLLHDAVWDEYFPQAVAAAPDLQVVLLEDGHAVAVGNGVPIAWDGTVGDLPHGTHGALRSSVEHPARDALCLIQAVTLVSHQGAGHATELMRRWIRLAKDGRYKVISPIRAVLKHHYPLIPLADYLTWTVDGRPFDPWIRAQHALGGVQGPVCADALRIDADVASWRTWTGQPLPGSGRHVIDGGQVPLDVDLAADLGVYSEEHVWYTYPEAAS